MTFPFSKAFSLSAIAAVSTLGIAIAQPAEAISVTRSSPLTSVGSYPVLPFDFNSVPAGNINKGNTVPNTPLGLTITNSTTGNGNQPIQIFQVESGDNALRNASNDTRQVTFDFSGQPLAYFGVRFLNLGTNLTVSLFNVTGQTSSQVGSTYTGAFLSGLSGSDNYFNFNSPLVGQRFNQVVISGQQFQLDDIAYAVPTPALLPGLVGMGVAALRKRNAEEEQEA